MSNMEQKVVRLGEISKLYAGGDAPKEVSHERTDEFCYPIYSNGLEKEGLYGYSKKATMKENTITVSARGTVGAAFYRKEKFLPIVRLITIEPNEKIINGKYLYYYLLMNKLEGYGTSQQQLTLPFMKKRKLLIFSDVAYQQKIVNVLSQYDEQIENNNKRIKILEEMAENLYKEWFVRFRFPGYKEVGFINGIPEKWNLIQLQEVLDIKRGGSPRPIQEYLAEDGFRWLKISDATKSDNPYIMETEEFIKEEGLRKTVLLKSGCLVLSNSATPGIPRILAVDTCIHDGWLYFSKQKFSNEVLYLLFKNIRPKLVTFGNGAVFTNLKTDILKNYSIIKPDDFTLKKFENIVKPIFNNILTLTKNNKNLIEQRDLLLPRLMSGKLEINNLEQQNLKIKTNEISFDEFKEMFYTKSAARAQIISEEDIKAAYEVYIDEAGKKN